MAMGRVVLMVLMVSASVASVQNKTDEPTKAAGKLLEKPGKTVQDVPCADGGTCPDGDECCPNHGCCPAGYTCGSGPGSECTKLDGNAVAKLLEMQTTMIKDVPCGGGEFCPDGDECCPNHGCCPAGYTCGSGPGGECTKLNGNAVAKLLEKPTTTIMDVPCGGGEFCPDGDECCPNHGCCPAGTTCGSGPGGECTKLNGNAVAKLLLEKPTMMIKDVPCGGGEFCPDGDECCPNHGCCPAGTTCGSGPGGECTKLDGNAVAKLLEMPRKTVTKLDRNASLIIV